MKRTSGGTKKVIANRAHRTWAMVLWKKIPGSPNPIPPGPHEIGLKHRAENNAEKQRHHWIIVLLHEESEAAETHHETHVEYVGVLREAAKYTED